MRSGRKGYWAALSALLLLVSCGTESLPQSPPAGSSGAAGSATTGGGGSGGGDANTSGSTATLGGAGAGGAGASGGGGSAGTGAASGAAGTSTAGNAGEGGTAGTGGVGTAGGGTAGSSGSGGTSAEAWVGTWSSAQQLTEEANKPPSPGLTNNTLRQIVRVSIGGQKLRLRFSNEYGSTPVTLNGVHIASSAGGSAITAATSKPLAFAGMSSVTIPAKEIVWSDAVDFALEPLSKLAVSIHFGATSADITGHPGSRTTSYLQAGNAAGNATLSAPVSTDHWYVLSGIDVMAADDARALVILGDSITDGRGTTTNGNDRWPDALAERLKANTATARVGVLNQGIGGNAILNAGLGPTAMARFEADVLKQSGVRYVIVFEGVNDIGDNAAAADITAAYQQFVTKARSAGLRIYGATILPFKGHSYYSQAHETARIAVNTWIRTAGNFDAVIDLDAAVRSPQAMDTLLSNYDSGDHLHLNPTGYKQLASAVDLQLFQ